MIVDWTGDILLAPVDAFVNTVNTVGVMGKGIALQFKHAYPKNFEAYAAACRDNRVKIGKMFVWPGPPVIVNFPTKQHWRDPSRLEWIEAGLDDLAHVITAQRIKSIAVPRLGCGNGGLSWTVVKPMIVAALQPLPTECLLVSV